MATKTFIRTAVFTAILMAVSACIYPYDPKIEGGDDRLVVDGDIHIGSISAFSFSKVYPFDSDQNYFGGVKPLHISGYIEGEDGTKVVSVPSTPSSNMVLDAIEFDTSELTANQRYRLHFENESTGTVFESDWIDVCPAPAIDSLSYILDGERGELDVALSMHCEGSSHFRWRYSEEWEFHTEARAGSFYVPELNSIRRFEKGENTYYCWRKQDSPEIKIFSTENQVEDRFVDLEFHRIRRNDQRLQIMYHIEVFLEGLNEDAYDYWINLKQNSQEQGSIFAPTPSMMAGNIHCISDPSIPVIGYINASEAAKAEMYYDNSKEKFYKNTSSQEFSIIELKPEDFASFWKNGFAPFDVIEDPGQPPVYQWALRRCVDCTILGGTKKKPDGWPNDHK